MALKAKPHEFDGDHVSGATTLLAHNVALRENIQAVAAIKSAMDARDYPDAYGIWELLPENVRDALWVAPTLGGVFTTEERKIMQTNVFINGE